MKYSHCSTVLFIGCALVAAGCSGSSNSSSGEGGAKNATGGAISTAGTSTSGTLTSSSTSSTGGTSAAGGVTSTGGTTGSGVASSAGGSGVGGTTALGTTSVGGKSAAGGTTGVGGVTGVGGLTGAGGKTGGGGGSATGGKTGGGGVTATGAEGGATSAGGGATTGGKTSSGGATAVGGTTSTGGNSNTGGTTSAGTGTVATPGFDWVGIVGTGQSLSVGTGTTNMGPYYNNLMLSLEGVTVPADADAGVANPWDTSSTAFKMKPLIDAERALHTNYPSPYPGNLYGQTPHGALAREITHLVQAASASADYVTVHTIVGESGQGMVALKKQTGSTTGDIGRAYAATLFEAGAITRLAKAESKTYGVGMVMMTHGETDCQSKTYKDELLQMMVDYNKDISAVTGQTTKIPMYISQQHAYPNSAKGDRPIANNTQWQLGVEHKGDYVCTGPKYQYPGAGDGIHLSLTGYQLLGEKTAQVYYQRAVLGKDWQPLMPTTVERSGRVVTVHFNVPVPPLNFDSTLDAAAITQWASGKGFELRVKNADADKDLTDTTNYITISSVAISGDAVQITAGADLPTSNLVVGYAYSDQGKKLSGSVHSGAVRWGQLRDSDTFTGTTTNQANPNYCVSFEIPVP